MSDFALGFMLLGAAAFLLVALWAGWRLFFKSGNLRDAPSQSAPRPARRSDAKDVLRIERDAADGLVSIWLNGERVEHTGTVADSRWEAAVRQLLSALNAPSADAEAPAVIAQPAPVAGPVPVEPQAEMALDDDMHRPFLARVRESMSKPRAYAASALPVPPSGDKDKEQPAWMFARVNDILQRMLSEQSGMPEIEISGEGSEIRIRLNGQTYTTLGDVPDERARALIRSAVAEWERT
jgi:hypothetical protein